MLRFKQGEGVLGNILWGGEGLQPICGPLRAPLPEHTSEFLPTASIHCRPPADIKEDPHTFSTLRAKRFSRRRTEVRWPTPVAFPRRTPPVLLKTDGTFDPININLNHPSKPIIEYIFRPILYFTLSPPPKPL